MGFSGVSTQYRVLIALFLTFTLLGISPLAGEDDRAEAGPYEGSGGGSGSRAYDLDVGVTSIDPIPVMPQNPTDFFPGQTITINVTLENFGDTDISVANGNTFEVLFVVSDQQSYTHTDKQTIVALNSLSEFTISFKWVPPVNPPVNSSWGAYPHTFMLHAYTLLEGDQDSSNNARSKAFVILEPAFDPRLDYRDGSESTLKADVGAIVYFEFTLYNDGDSSDIILLDVIKLPTDWAAIPFSTEGYNLDDHDNTSDRLRLTVMVSDNKDFAMADQNYEITLRAKSLNYPMATDTLTFKCQVNFKPGVIVEAPFEDHAFTPGTIQYLRFNITNNANDADSFRVMVEIPTMAKLKMWDAHISEGSTVGPLKRGQSGVTTVMLTVPQGLWKGQSLNIRLWAQSMNPKSKNKPGNEDEVYVLIRAGEVYQLSLPDDDELKPTYVRPGRQASIPFNVTNDGNVKDNTMEWAFSSPEGWVCGLDLSLIPDGGLGQLNVATISMDIFVPQNEQFGTYYITVWVFSGKDTPQKLQDSVTLEVIVEKEYKVQLSATSARKEGEIGTVVNYKMKLKNTGNSDDTYSLSASSQWVTFTPDRVSVSYGHTQEITASVRVPLNASGDTNPISRDHRDGYRIDLSAQSQNNSAMVSTYQIEVMVEPYYNFEVRAPVELKSTTSDRETVVEFDLEVENFGNIADIIDFDVLPSESGDDWGIMRSIHRPVSTDRSEHVKFEALPPLKTEKGLYRFSIQCTSQGSRELVKQGKLSQPVAQVVDLWVEITTMDLEMGAPMVNGDPVPLGGNLRFDEGDSLLFSVDITNWAGTNYTNTLYGDIIVRFYVDDPEDAYRQFNISFMESWDNMTVGFRWGAKLGPHQVWMRVDPQNHVPESDEGNNEQLVKLTVYGEGQSSEEKGAISDNFLSQYLAHILIMILCIFVAVVLFYARTKIKELEEEETGYTEDGEYKPYREAYEAFKEEEDRFESEAAADPEHPYVLPGAKGRVTASTLYSSTDSPYGDAMRSGEKSEALPVNAAELALLPSASIEKEKPGEKKASIRSTKPMRSTKPAGAGEAKIRTTKPVGDGPARMSVDLETMADPEGQGLGLQSIRGDGDGPAPAGTGPAPPGGPAAPPAPGGPPAPGAPAAGAPATGAPGHAPAGPGGPPPGPPPGSPGAPAPGAPGTATSPPPKSQ